MPDRREMTHLFKSESEAKEALRRQKEAMTYSPPMWPITNIQVERRLVGKNDYRWVVAGDFQEWNK